MNSIAVQTPSIRRWHQWTLWAGRIVSVLPVLIVLLPFRRR
jgi:hypothetical protein